MPEKRLSVGPFLGVNDTRNLAAQDGQRASYLLNQYAPAAQVGGDLISRPGVTRIGFTRSPSSYFAVRTFDLTGTVSFGAGSASVTGVSTLFLTELRAGMYVYNATDAAPYLVQSIESNTALTLSTTVTNALSGTVPAYSSSSGTNTHIFTHIADAIAVGDIITVNGQERIIITRTDSQHFVAGAAWTTGGYTTACTVKAAGIEDGPIYGIWNYQATDGTVKRLLIVKTTNALVAGSAAGKYRFLGASNERLRLVEYDPSAAILTLVDRTSVSMDGVTLDITTRIYCTTFANYFIISDGTNRPRKVTAAFVLTNMTDANYAFAGPLTLYYGKLFGIDASDNVTIRWSDENDPDAGFGTSTSDNSWTLRQTSSDQLRVLVGSNEALYCARDNSWAIITGAANSDFRSSGTVDAIQTVGCRSPDAAFLINSSVVFTDQYGRLGRIEPGYGYIPLWKRTQETVRGVALTAAQLRAAWGRYDPVTNLAKFALRWTSAATTNTQMLCFDVESWECLGVHIWYSASTTAMDHAYSAVLLDENNRPRHAVASGTTADLAFYVQKTEDDQAASARDTLAAGSQMVPVQADLPWVGGDAIEESQFNRVAVNIRNVGGGAAGLVSWKLAFRTPNVDFATAAAMTVSGASATFANALTKAEMPGLNAQGRAIQIRLTNDTSGNTDTRSTLDTVTVIAVGGDKDYARR